MVAATAAGTRANVTETTSASTDHHRNHDDGYSRSNFLLLLADAVHGVPTRIRGSEQEQRSTSAECHVNVNFYPSGQWRLGRGFPVNHGNHLSSAQTHYKPRVFLECDKQHSPDDNAQHVDVVFFSVPFKQRSGSQGADDDATAKNSGKRDSESTETGDEKPAKTGWLHWLVTDIPVQCASSASGGCDAAASSVLGTPLHPDHGRTLVEYVPPGVSELSLSSSSTDETPTTQAYIVAVYSVDPLRTSHRETTPLVSASSDSADTRVLNLLATIPNLLSPLGPSPKLIGFQYFFGTVDSMAQMQFGDVKSDAHGIVHMSRHVDGEL